MKHLIRNFATFACGAVVAISMTSCHSNEVGYDGIKKSNVVEVKATKTLVVNLSRALAAGESLTYNGATGSVSGTTVTFENVADGKTLSLTGSTLIAQSAVVNFGERNTVVMDVTVVSPSAGTPIPSTGSASDMSDTDTYDGSTSTITMPASTTSQAGVAGKKLSITMYAPMMPPITDLSVGEKKVTPYDLFCEPEGVTFSTPVKISTDLPGSEQCNVKYVYKNNASEETGTLNGTKLDAELTHFSIWEILLRVNIVSYEESVEQIGAGSLNAGANSVSYNEKAGYDSDVKGVLARTLSAMFGAKAVSVPKSSVFTVDVPSTYVLYQRVKVVTLRSGNRTFVARVYGSVYSEITADAQTPTTPSEPTVTPDIPVHNGGGSE